MCQELSRVCSSGSHRCHYVCVCFEYGMWCMCVWRSFVCFLLFAVGILSFVPGIGSHLVLQRLIDNFEWRHFAVDRPRASSSVLLLSDTFIEKRLMCLEIFYKRLYWLWRAEGGRTVSVTLSFLDEHFQTNYCWGEDFYCWCSRGFRNEDICMLVNALRNHKSQSTLLVYRTYTLSLWFAFHL